MELSLLPGEKTVKRTYRHFTINSHQGIEENTRRLEFFYIGKKSGNVDILIKAFESGYAAENLDNARGMLNRMVENSGSLPDLIIADASVGYSWLFELYQFLKNNKSLYEVPFVVDGSKLTSEELVKFRRYEFIDEILFLQNYNKHSLSAKVNFLKKVKKQAESQNTNGKPGVETSLTGSYDPSEIFKRIFDIVISTLLLLVLSPVFLVIILALKIESRGPILYVAKRAGRGYRIFDFYKFRTMYVGADEKINDFSHLNQYNVTQTDTPVFIKINNDPRVTKIGVFLRNTSLDELPQLFNVLIGDMSLVGNRPLPLYEAASLTTDEWAKRFMAPAGITGLWQIKKRGREEMSVEERISLDINYADKYNFLYDLWIMANTPSALIQKNNV